MKKLFYVTALSALLLAACGGDKSAPKSNSASGENEESVSDKVIVDSDVQALYSEPKKFKGYQYDFVGRVFTTPEKDEDGIYLQVFADPKKSEMNTIVYYADSNFKIQSDDYVIVSSVVKDEFEGENMMGGKVIAPMVEAKKLEVTDYASVMAPTLQIIEVNKEMDQHGYVVKVDKIEFAEPHTRVYFTVTNNSNHKISFYSHNTKLISGGTQLEEEYDYEANYPELQSELLPGITTSGVIVFPALDPATTGLKIYTEGYSDNYDIDLQPFTFDIN